MMPDLEMPEQVPVMTLPGAVLFPQAMMPLQIFEPRDRQMLEDTLARRRLFAVARLNEKLFEETGQFEPPYNTATVGMVRACQKHDDGTSNLILQGLRRVSVLRIVHEVPYRIIEIESLNTSPGATEDTLRNLRSRLQARLQKLKKLCTYIPDVMIQFLRTVEDPETFLDLAAYMLCGDANLKQKLLETLETRARYQLFSDFIEHENQQQTLLRKLKGDLGPNEISKN